MKTNKQLRRRASLTTELLLIAPVLLAIVFVFIQIGLMLSATQRLTAASQNGARVAARGGSQKDVEHAIREVLGQGRFEKARIEAKLNDPATGRPWQTGESIEVVVKMAVADVLPRPLIVAGAKDELSGRSVVRKE